MFGKENRKLKKIARREREIQAQKEKEMQARINVKKTLSSMKKQAEKLETFKKEYIEKAREASLVGNKQAFALAKSGLKLCLSKQRFIESMIANFEISIQIGDMNKVIGEFVKGMGIISDQMSTVTSTLDMTKAQVAYENALANNAGQYEALGAFLATAAESVDSIDGLDDGISDEEIENLITNQVLDAECNLDKEIEEKIECVRQKMNA